MNLMPISEDAMVWIIRFSRLPTRCSRLPTRCPRLLTRWVRQVHNFPDHAHDPATPGPIWCQTVAAVTTNTTKFYILKLSYWLPDHCRSFPGRSDFPHIRSSYRSEPFWVNLRTAVSTDHTLGERPFFSLLHSNNDLLTIITIPQGSSTVQAPTM